MVFIRRARRGGRRVRLEATGGHGRQGQGSRDVFFFLGVLVSVRARVEERHRAGEPRALGGVVHARAVEPRGHHPAGPFALRRPRQRRGNAGRAASLRADPRGGRGERGGRRDGRRERAVRVARLHRRAEAFLLGLRAGTTSGVSGGRMARDACRKEKRRSAPSIREHVARARTRGLLEGSSSALGPAGPGDLVAAETSIARDGRHHASARQHVVAFATRVPRKGPARGCRNGRGELNGHLAFGKSRKKRTRGEGKHASLRVGRAGLARGDEARGDASVRDHDRVHPFRGPAPGSGGHVVRRGDARGEAAAPRRKDIQSHRETSPRGDSRAETEGGARVASFESGRGGEAAGSVAAGEVRR